MESIKKTIITVLIIATAASIYFGSYLSLVKSQRYIKAIGELQSVKTLDDYKKALDRVLDFWAPVSEIEIVKFAGGDMANIVAQEGQPEDAALGLIVYIEGHSQNEVLQMINLAYAYQSLWRRYGKDEYFKKTEGYFKKIREIGPDLPQGLYGLFDLYRATGQKERVREFGGLILKNWPDDKNVQTVLDGIADQNASTSAEKK